MKKNILFFSRSELTYLYGSVHKYLKDHFNIIHIAYSNTEANILLSEFGIENVTVFKESARKFLHFKPNRGVLSDIDELLLETSSGNFNLNSMLQSNRTSTYIGYDKAIRAAYVYYQSWKQIFKKQKVDFFIHEPVSLMMNQMAAAICKVQGGVYTTHILVRGEEGKHHFIMLDHYNGIPIEIMQNYGTINYNDLQEENTKIMSFLGDFRSSYEVFFNALGSGSNSWGLKIKLLKDVVKYKIIEQIRKPKFDPVLDNIEIFIQKDQLSRRRLRNIASYKEIQYDEFDPSLSYYFYPIHLEPEAVVLYWADGIYTNQVKLIENIASQLPPHTFLYVKDHPHLYGYRDKDDYGRIQSIPNVRLLKSSISGKQIIKDSKGVITINGTGGFEALLMNKHVLVFGSSFYGVSKRVKYINHIKDLRSVIYSLQGVNYTDDDELKHFVLSYLRSQKEGFTDFYGGMHKVLNIDLDSNGALVAEGLKKYFNEYKN